MPIEEDYLDVLQNLEFAIISVYREEPALLDYDVKDAVDALIRYYTAEQNGHTAPVLRLHDKGQKVFESVKPMCEVRLGREPLLKNKKPIPIEAITVAELIPCLKRIQLSISRWTKRYGRQGYLNFVSQHIR